MTVNCSATRAGLKDMKCEGENSSSKLLSSGVAKGQVHRSPAKNKRSCHTVSLKCHFSVVQRVSCLHLYWNCTFKLNLWLLPMPEVFQQVMGPSLQVWSREVEFQVGYEALQASMVWRAPEILRILIQPCTQDRWDSTAMNIKIKMQQYSIYGQYRWANYYFHVMTDNR